jgi:hypothetical protein
MFTIKYLPVISLDKPGTRKLNQEDGFLEQAFVQFL